MVHLWNDESLVPAKYKSEGQLDASFKDAKDSSAMLNEDDEVPALWACGTFLVIPVPSGVRTFDEESDNEVKLPEQDGMAIIVVMS